MSGVNGCMEHIFAIQLILGNARDKALPLCLSFIDLRNVFGSISHSYILDMLNYIKLPSEIQAYVRNLYSSLAGYVSTKTWSTASFKIRRGVFQRDTLSPLLFLIAFHPIIASVSSHPSHGFSLQIDQDMGVKPSPPPSSPPVGSYIYTYWMEENSDEKPGWYLAKVTSVNAEDNATLHYRSNRSFESVCLSTIKWVPAKGNGKWYLPQNPRSLTSLPLLQSSVKSTSLRDLQMISQ